MPVFSYEGFDKTGRHISGKIEAENDAIARDIIKNKGIYIKNLVSLEKQGRRGREKIRKEDFALSIRELATLLNSGLTLDESVSGIIAQMKEGKLRDVYTSIQKQVREGKSFSDALRDFPAIFP
ncbi:MAG TPA: type II secretion system F family protein, partial [bacterium]|nr:type II secretion system F family protein [bacterium]